MKEFVLNSKGFNDIKPLFAGEHECLPSHKYGPYVRKCYLVHFCLSGKGVLFDKRGEHHVSAGELFIIRPDEVTTYIADGLEPWHYIWIGFDGALAGAFDGGDSVYGYSEELGERLHRAVSFTERNAHLYSAILHELISAIRPAAEEQEGTASEVKRYIRYNYMSDISATSVSAAFGFERSYLYRVFKARYGIGIKEYIVRTRMEEAKTLLSEGKPVGATARAVGYKDEFNFSKAFKKHYGESPGYYLPKKNSR